MDSELDHSVLVRLSNIKGTYELALKLLEMPTTLDGGIALVLMDNSLEAMFKLTLDNQKNSFKEESVFLALFQQIIQVKEMESLKSKEMQLKIFRRARNDFQHYGIIPSLNTVINEYKPLLEQIFNLICTKIFHVEWKDISLSLLIKDKKIRELYQKSEKSFTECDYLTSASYLIYTFEYVKKLAKLYIFGSGLSGYRFILKDNDDDLTNYVMTLDEEIETFKLKLDYVDLRNYLDMAHIAGIENILYDLPSEEKEENIVNAYKKNLEKIPDATILKEWCLKMRDPILRFIIRTEESWRWIIPIIRKITDSLPSVFKENNKPI